MTSIDADILGLQEGIKNCKRNIDLLNEAIKRENETIDNYKFLIHDKNNDYDKDALKDGIDSCEKNIQTFNETVDTEREHIKNSKILISDLREKQELEKQNGINNTPVSQS